MQDLTIDPYVIKYIAGLHLPTPDDIVAWYVEHMVFHNEGYLEHLIDKYKLPKNDFLKIHKRITELSGELTKRGLSPIAEE